MTYRILRGGSWLYNSYYLRSSYRYNYVPSIRNHNIGFRVVRRAK